MGSTASDASPATSGSEPRLEITTGTRDAIASAAADAGALFVDPLGEEWLLAGAELIGTDGVHPNDSGHAYLADLIEPIVREALVGEPVA